MASKRPAPSRWALLSRWHGKRTPSERDSNIATCKHNHVEGRRRGGDLALCPHHDRPGDRAVEPGRPRGSTCRSPPGPPPSAASASPSSDGTQLGAGATVLVLASAWGSSSRYVPASTADGVPAGHHRGRGRADDLVKAVVERPRPAISQIITPTGSSFPSGHSAAAAAAFAALAIVLARDRWLPVRRTVCIGAVTVAMVVAWSRVLLRHWYSDVIAGLALGWGWCALCSVAVELGSVRPDADPADDHRDRRATNRRAASTTAPTSGRPEGDGVEGARGVVALARRPRARHRAHRRTVELDRTLPPDRSVRPDRRAAGAP